VFGGVGSEKSTVSGDSRDRISFSKSLSNRWEVSVNQGSIAVLTSYSMAWGGKTNIQAGGGLTGFCVLLFRGGLHAKRAMASAQGNISSTGGLLQDLGLGWELF